MALSVVMANATTWSIFFFLSIFFFFFSTPLAYADHAIVVSGRETTKPSMLLPLPRKLKLLEEVASIEVHQNNKGDHHLHDGNVYKEEDGASTLTSSGKSYKEKKDEDGDEEEGGIDTTQYYTTMDYSHVRKRRPIHNKSLPRGP